MMLALAVLDLPFEAAKHTTKTDGGAFTPELVATVAAESLCLRVRGVAMGRWAMASRCSGVGGSTGVGLSMMWRGCLFLLAADGVLACSAVNLSSSSSVLKSFHISSGGARMVLLVLVCSRKRLTRSPPGVDSSLLIMRGGAVRLSEVRRGEVERGGASCATSLLATEPDLPNKHA